MNEFFDKTATYATAEQFYNEVDRYLAATQIKLVRKKSRSFEVAKVKKPEDCRLNIYECRYECPHSDKPDAVPNPNSRKIKLDCNMHIHMRANRAKTHYIIVSLHNRHNHEFIALNGKTVPSKKKDAVMAPELAPVPEEPLQTTNEGHNLGLERTIVVSNRKVVNQAIKPPTWPANEPVKIHSLPPKEPAQPIVTHGQPKIVQLTAQEHVNLGPRIFRNSQLQGVKKDRRTFESGLQEIDPEVMRPPDIKTQKTPGNFYSDDDDGGCSYTWSGGNKATSLEYVLSEMKQTVLEDEDNMDEKLDCLSIILDCWRHNIPFNIKRACQDETLDGFTDTTPTVTSDETAYEFTLGFTDKIETPIDTSVQFPHEIAHGFTDMTAIDTSVEAAREFADELNQDLKICATRGKGRPKGSKTTTAIGLRKGTKLMPYVHLSHIEQLTQILQLLIADYLIPFVVRRERLIKTIDFIVTDTSLSDAVMDEAVAFKDFKKYFELMAYELLLRFVNQKRDSNKYSCGSCKKSFSDDSDSVFCNRCLLWYDYHCVNITKRPKSPYWFCESCVKIYSN